jgi:hypothetical protein
MAKVSVDLSDELDGDDSAKKIKELAAPLPSVSKAKSSALKDAPRVPKPIKEAFAEEASKRKITQKELLYECLRAGGINIPANSKIDGRRR